MTEKLNVDDLGYPKSHIKTLPKGSESNPSVLSAGFVTSLPAKYPPWPNPVRKHINDDEVICAALLGARRVAVEVRLLYNAAKDSGNTAEAEKLQALSIDADIAEDALQYVCDQRELYVPRHGIVDKGLAD